MLIRDSEAVRKIALRKDKAVSPIIGTVLLVAITVTLAATLYTILIPYFDNYTSSTPQATLDITNKTSLGIHGVEGYCMLYVGSIDSNVSSDSVSLLVTTSTGQIYHVPSVQTIASSGTVGTDVIPNNGSLTVSYSGTKNYISTDSSFKFTFNDSSFYLTRIALIDVSSGGVMGSIIIQ